MAADDSISILKSILWAVFTGGASQLAAMITGPIMIASFQISASLGWLGIILIAVVMIRLVIQDTREYLEMGVYATIALLMLALPLAAAVILMVFSGIALERLGETVNWRAWA